jgi:hypothetical protein
MSVETTTNIAGLVTTNPAVTDPVYDGPNHFWLIKSVLKNIFPGAGGVGFVTPIIATEAELNYLDGASSNIQDQIDAINAKTLHILLNDGTTIVDVALS